MTTMFIIFFIVGLGFIALSFIVGEVADFEGTGFAWLSPTLIALFLMVTGGLGLILNPRLEILFVLLISFFGGLIVAGLMNRLVIAPLRRAQNTSTFNIQDTIGQQAEVISKIPQGGYGTIKYNISGSIVTSPAKSDAGNEILQGECVEIVYIEKNTYFVKKISS